MTIYITVRLHIRHYTLKGLGIGSTSRDEAGRITVSGLDPSFRLALYNHENGADVYIMLLHLSEDSDGQNTCVDGLSPDLDSDHAEQFGLEDEVIPIPVRLGPTADDDEWVTLAYGEAVRWDVRIYQ